MLTVPHMLAGAAIGALVPETPTGSVVAFGLGWLSHYVLDSTPHWERLFNRDITDFETELPVEEWPRTIFYQAMVDVVIAVTVMYLLIHHRNPYQPIWSSPIFWGAFGGFFPDLIDNLPVINRLNAGWPIFQQERIFHQTIHVSGKTQQTVWPYLGLLTQVTVIGIALYFLRK